MTSFAKRSWSALAIALVGAGAAGGASLVHGCSSNPVNVPVRTFERAQKVDVMCLRVLAPDPNNPGAQMKIQAVPLRQDECAPVPVGVDTSQLPNHLYALVTQTTRGEIALVDLTSGGVVDEDRSTPGINFIPVGQLPTDVAVSLDGAMAFVSTAEPNKPAIYGIPAARILGDSQWPVPFQLPPPLTLPALPACSLPQAPIALAILPRDTAGAGYEVAAVLAGTGGARAKLVTIDPLPFLRGADPDAGAGAKIDPGSLEPCPVTAVIDLGDGEHLLPPTFVRGAPWDDGVKYVEGGVDLRPTDPAPAASCAMAIVDGGVDGGAEAGADANDAAADAGDAADAGLADGAYPLDFGPLDPPRPTGLALDDQLYLLYVADGELPIIHVLDVSTPGTPRELPPLLATSLDEPSRKVSVGGLTLSPATSDFKRYLYAVDAKQGSLIVYDVTAGAASARTPLVRPHPELNPFQPVDRIVFNAPVAAVSFVKHDWPLLQNKGVQITGKTGLICNPNPNAQIDPTDPMTIGQTDEALGAAYMPNSGVVAVTLGPYRLRGIFALATLSNGQVVTVDVDDWDAPCRRPDPLGPDKCSASDTNACTHTTQPSALAAPEPSPTSNTDTNPYHAPLALRNGANGSPIDVATTSLESFFPVSAPHQPRSGYFLRNDPQTGLHIPNLTGLPQLVSQNAAKPTTGTDGLANPIMLPTFSAYADPSFIKNPTEPNPSQRASTLQPPALGLPATQAFALPGIKNNTTPGVRFAWEDPHVHVDQDWQVVYEGALPGFDGLSAKIDATPGDPLKYESLTLTVANGLLCRRGIEDVSLANARMDAQLAAMRASNLPPFIDPYKWTGDYVQMADDVLPQGDPYWREENDDCWDPSLTPQPGEHVSQTMADARQSACQNAYGSLSDVTPTPFRDFPILEAYDDHVVVSRFGYEDPGNPATVNRQVVARDPSNVPALKLARCCFHHQSGLKVRTGGQWVATGSAVGYLHHVKADAAGRCVQSCETRDLLLSSRAPDLPRPSVDATGDPKDPAHPPIPPDRNSPLAMRNPMFAFVIWSGAAPVATPQNLHPGHTTTQRDMAWRFSTRGQFTPLTILLSPSSTSVSPQSMRFIDSLGQLAVVDGASQGLVLIDLNGVALAHAPYF